MVNSPLCRQEGTWTNSFLLLFLLVFGWGSRGTGNCAAEALVEPTDTLGDTVVARFEPIAGLVEHATCGRAAREKRNDNGQREKCAFQDETPSEPGRIAGISFILPVSRSVN